MCDMTMLRFIISETNKLLGKNFDVISFDSMSSTELLQVLVDVLNKYEATEWFNVNANIHEATIKIIEGLENIKYSPGKYVSPAEFRDGISQGKRAAVHTILLWIHSNPLEVTHRAYLSKYLVKLEIPAEIMSDPEVQSQYSQYLSLRNDFKTVYSEYTKGTRLSFATQEVRRDLARMEKDIEKVDKRIEKQKSKVLDLPNKEALLVTVRSYRAELLQNNNTTAELKDTKDNIVTLGIKIKQLKSELAEFNLFDNDGGDGPIERMKNELQVNRMIIEDRIKAELTDAKTKLENLELVVDEAEPTPNDLEKYEQQLDTVSRQVEELVERRKIQANPKTDKMRPFRQQANIIASQRQESAEKLMRVKSILKDIEEEINEKRSELERQVGGKILHGDELRSYVKTLRSRSVLHKDIKATHQAMSAEVGLLTRTLEIMQLLDQDLASYLQNRDKLVAPIEEPTGEIPTTIEAITDTCTELSRRIDAARAVNAQCREEMLTVKTEVNGMSGQYKTFKETYEEATGDIVKAVETVTEDLEEKGKEIEEGEEKWKNLQREIKLKENILFSITEEISMLGDKEAEEHSRKNILKRQLATEEAIKLKLTNEIAELEKLHETNENEVKILRGTIEVLKQKLN